MNTQYEIRMHKDGYEVAPVGVARGISTHADILDALTECRVANRFARYEGLPALLRPQI